jgi:alpha-tubulin suppressor-like RCC1 family protein
VVSNAPWGGAPPDGCERGGAKVESFVDTNGNGNLDVDLGEFVDSTQYVCNVFLAQVSTGFAATCATVSDGTVRCWGTSFDFSQTSSIPATVLGVSSASAVTMGDQHACAALLDGTVACWGDNSQGQLGVDPGTLAFSAEPLLVDGVADVISLSAAGYHTCALLLDQSIVCWGDNFTGVLGQDPVAVGFSAAPVPIALPALATRVEAGAVHVCAVLDDGTVACWGDNTFGQLGVDPTVTPLSIVPVSPALVDLAADVAAGADFTCASLIDSSVYCWGNELDGRLGFDDGEAFTFTPGGLGPTPAAFGAVTDVPGAITAGTDHACVLVSDGSVGCWGSNASGQLGIGDVPPVLGAMPVSGLGSARSVSAGAFYSCAVLADGGAKCWGDNAFGQLGDGTNVTPRLAPTPVVTATAP